MIIIAEVSFAQMAKFLFHLLFILIYHCRYLHILFIFYLFNSLF